MKTMRIVTTGLEGADWVLHQADVEEDTCFIELHSIGEHNLKSWTSICLKPGHGIRFEEAPRPTPYYY